MASHLKIRDDATVNFSAVSISGDVLYAAEHNDLVLIDEETGCREALSVNLSAYNLSPRPGHVFIKDWSEGHGVTASLAKAGIVDVVAAYKVGPFASTAYEVKVNV